MRIAPEDWVTEERAYPYADTAKESLVFGGAGGQELVEPYIVVTPESVNFQGQRGPVKEFGVNGCQIDDVLTFALGTLQAMNKKFPCRENSIAITKLQECLHWLNERTRNRIERKVEGKNRD
jgi:hypothetical protein